MELARGMREYGDVEFTDEREERFDVELSHER